MWNGGEAGGSFNNKLGLVLVEAAAKPLPPTYSTISFPPHLSCLFFLHGDARYHYIILGFPMAASKRREVDWGQLDSYVHMNNKSFACTLCFFPFP